MESCGDESCLSAATHDNLRLLQTAIEALDPSDTSALLEALQRVPHLVESESDPDKFLRRDRYDATKAARRLSSYWRYRKLLFGKRAFLPMVINGEGAMSPDDIVALSRGFQVPLPPDVNGRSVIFTDKAKQCSLPQETRERCCFYSFQVASENSKSVDDGFVAVTLIDEMNFSQNTKTSASLIIEGLPITFFGSHIFCDPEKHKDRNHLYAKYAASMVTLMGMDVFEKTELHLTDTRQECRLKLQAMGFLPDAIPINLGGSWGETALKAWMAERSAYETAQLSKRVQPVSPGTDAIQGSSKLCEVPATQHALDDEQEKQTQKKTVPGRSDSVVFRAPIPGSQNVKNFAYRNDAARCGRDQYMNVNNEVIVSPQRYSSTHLDGFSIFQAQRVYQQQQNFKMPLESHQQQFISSSILGNPSTEAFNMQSAQRAGASQLHYNSHQHHIQTAPVLDNDDIEVHHERTRASVIEAVLKIPDSQKAAYTQAINESPHLVKQESDPMRFAHAENFDFGKAAKRLVEYWRLRQELFDDRAFLPMDQTKSGSLTRDDVVVLGFGTIALLPNDVQGCGVLLEDRQRKLNGTPEEQKSTLRCLFYSLSVLSEQLHNQTQGIVWLSLVVTPRVADFSEILMIERINVARCIPIKIKCAHVVCIPPKIGKKELCDSIVSFSEKVLRQHFGNNVFVQRGVSTKEICSKLAVYGLKKEGLPASLGGSWKYEELSVWQRKRTRHEFMAHDVDDGESSNCLNPESRAPRSLSTEQKKERKRMLNAIHSRQKRERRRDEAANLKNQREVWEEKNQRLKRDNECLQTMLDVATQKVELIEKGFLHSSDVSAAHEVARLVANLSHFR